MKLITLQYELKKVHDRADGLSFSELIRQCRGSVGMMQYRAAEFVGITTAKLKNLESAYFREAITQDDLLGFQALFALSSSLLKVKVNDHLLLNEKYKKIRTLHEKEM